MNEFGIASILVRSWATRRHPNARNGVYSIRYIQEIRDSKRKSNGSANEDSLTPMRSRRGLVR